MTEWLSQMLSFVAAALGLVSMPDAAALGLAIALLAVTTLALAIVLSVRPEPTADAPHPSRAINIDTPLTQNHPDAAGHPRPRAPGTLAAA